MEAGKVVFGGIKVTQEQYDDLVRGLFLTEAKWAKWMKGERWMPRPRPVYWCGECRQKFNSTVTPHTCPYCKSSAGYKGLLLRLDRGEMLVFPFLVDAVRLSLMQKLKGKLVEGWGPVIAASVGD